jgi:hypothetical protein
MRRSSFLARRHGARYTAPPRLPIATRWSSVAVAIVATITACSDQGPNAAETETDRRVYGAALHIVAGAKLQQGSVGSAVPVDPSVEVVDSTGVSLSNVTVTFSVVDGAGTVSAANVKTGADGRASTHWILGPRVGTNALSATVAGVAPVQFTASSLPILSIVAGGTPQRAVVGTGVDIAPVLLAHDALGAPVPNFPIRFTGDGTVMPAALTTDADGRAQTTSWTLKTVSGSQTLYAWPGTSVIVGTSVQFQATAVPGHADHIALTKTSIALPVGAAPSTVGVAFLDVYGNPTTDVGAITFSSSNTSAATVSELGEVRPVAAGWATVKVTADQVSASIPVMVFNRISNVGGLVWAVALLDDNTALVSISAGGSEAIRQVNLLTGELGAPIAVAQYPRDIAIDASRSVAYVASWLEGVSIVPLAGGSPVEFIPFHSFPGGATRVSLSRDAQRVYVSHEDGGIAVLDASTHEVVSSLGVLTQSGDPNLGLLNYGPLESLAISRDDSTLYVAAEFGWIGRLAAADGRILTRFDDGGRPEEVVLSPDGSELYVANTGTTAAGGWIDALDAATLQPKKRVRIAGPYAMALSPDGQTLIAGGPPQSQNPQITIVERSTLTVLGAYDFDSPTRRITFTSDGRAVIANVAGTVDLLPKGRP